MKNLQTFEEFLSESLITESVKFTKAALVDKLKQKLEIANKAAEKWGDQHPHYKEIPGRIEAAIKAGKIDMDSRIWMIQGGERSANYEIFSGNNAVLLAKEVAKVIKKYKKNEVKSSSVPAMAGYGNVSATVGGSIEGRANFNNGKHSYLIAVTIGSGVDRTTREKMMNELFPLFYMLDEYNTSDGGVMVAKDDGTNYHTIGLQCSNLQFSQGHATMLRDILNGK